MQENVKKCKNFLSTLIKLASSQPKSTVQNVRKLIQDLIVSIIVTLLMLHVNVCEKGLQSQFSLKYLLD